MSQLEAKTTTRGEFTRHALPQARPWTKQTAGGPAVDVPLSWRNDKHAAQWLAGGAGPQLSKAQCEAIREAWCSKLDASLRRLCGGGTAAHVVLHEHCLECWVPLSPPAVTPEALRLWATAVNTQTHLIAINEACTKASIFIPLLQPSADDVELLDAALRYIAVELRPILEVLRRHPGLAANWGQWLRTPPQPERR
jgi:hypothetical protein